MLQGKVITFWSPRGNMGCTFNAINVAKRLNDTKGKTVLVDLNLKFPRISDYLLLQDMGHNIDNLYSYVAGNSLTNDIISVNVEKKDDLPILKGTTNTHQAEYVSVESLQPIIDALRDMYSYVIVDCGALINNAGTYVALKEADVVFALLTKDIISTMTFNDIKPLLFANFKDDKFKFIINNDSNKVFMPKEEIEKFLDINIVGSIPNVSVNVMNYINKGQFLEWMTTKEAMHYINTIDELIKQHILLNPEEILKTKKKKKVFSFFNKQR